MDAVFGTLSFQSFILLASIASGLIVGAQILICLWMVVALHMSGKERNKLSREVYGLLKRIEGLTSSKRERFLKHYDSILQNLSTRLPPTIAAEVSQQILETEAKILKRVAELEPSLRNNAESRKKIEELIASMEGLERSIVALASDTVKSVMLEGRKSLFQESEDTEVSLAA